MLRSIVARTAIAAASAALLLSSAARADDVKLPSSLTFTAHDTGSSGFNIAVAVGKMMKEKYNSSVRVLPAGNDVARLAPLRAGRAVASAMGTGSYFAQEGVFEFGAKEWGPQPIQLMLSTVDCNGLSVGIANDVGVKDLKDFKGKRLGFVVGSPALNQNALAIIAFAGLTKNDVKIVEFASYGAMWKGIINNDVDGAFASTISGQAKEAGHWTAEDQAHNDSLIKRQQVLSAAWTTYTKTNPPDDKFADGWSAARRAALAQAK
ncbi:MAG: TAXI family TRAP transporter solute-binding subunit, partial [Rhizobiales bacterium]|nr:TAXI family TRAP transporter solute-binding subunit [Hyphomicrobiales bacterium]